MKAKEQLEYEIRKSGLSKREWYRTIYLQSDHWRLLREEKFKASGKVCVGCDRSNDLQVHHKKYRSIFNVTVDDLEVLCRHCHTAEHEALKKERRARRLGKVVKISPKQSARIQREASKLRKNTVFGMHMPKKSDPVSCQHAFWMAVASIRCKNKGDEDGNEMSTELSFILQKWGSKMSPLARQGLKQTRSMIAKGMADKEEKEADSYVPELDNKFFKSIRRD